MADFTRLTAVQLSRGYKAGKFKPTEIIREALEQAAGSDLNCFITLTDDLARKQAASADMRFAGEKTGPSLTGIPVAVKDNICLEGYPATCGSKILENFTPPYNATVTEKVIGAGAAVIGKTNMDEFGMGSSNEYSAFGPVLNPVSKGLVPGGSSGGSAAAVASGTVPIAYGTDTGGSIRQPAAFCGVYGLRPTYGAVSRYGLVAFASSMDQIGPIAGTVGDLALAYQVIAGYDRRDATSVGFEHPDYFERLEAGRKFKIGLPLELLEELNGREIDRALQDTIQALKDDGHEIAEVSVPAAGLSTTVHYIIANAEASSNLARYDGVGYGLRRAGSGLDEMYLKTRSAGFGDEAKRRIMIGTYVLSAGYKDAYYQKAQEFRQVIKSEFDAAFKQVDLILTPTTPGPPFEFGEKTADPLQMYLSDVLTTPANVAYLPAITVPFTQDSEGRPIGMQFMSERWGELKLFQVARRLEMIRGV